MAGVHSSKSRQAAERTRRVMLTSQVEWQDPAGRTRTWVRAGGLLFRPALTVRRRHRDDSRRVVPQGLAVPIAVVGDLFETGGLDEPVDLGRGAELERVAFATATVAPLPAQPL